MSDAKNALACARKSMGFSKEEIPDAVDDCERAVRYWTLVVSRLELEATMVDAGRSVEVVR